MTPRQFGDLIPQLQEKLRQAVIESVQHAAMLIAQEAKDMIGHEQENWPPLAPSTIEQKQREGYEVPAPLLRTGHLRDSITFHVHETTASIGSNEPEAVVHEHGDSKVPPRPFLSSAAMKKLPEIGADLEVRLQRAFTGEK